ncbi:hypothetical protein R5R35_005512 [Gryllus longicercus]|uniref:Chemosensory protein n=1 Tax=Gryllus longicercus TaxID=2509291 RepID=A0AAN9VKS5_9ORTH
MHRGIVLFLAICTLWAVATAVERYTDKYDNINLQEILNNERLFKKYLECLLADSDSRCTADGRELRKAIPDALTTECSKCTAKQRSGAATVIKHLRDNRPGDWAKLQAKWDPQGIFVTKYADRFPA